MHFWIDIEVTKVLGQFKQKNSYKFNHDMQFQGFFNLLNLIFVNYNIFFNTLLNKLQDHVFICSIWMNFEKIYIC
jgi:hypothetical protein